MDLEVLVDCHYHEANDGAYYEVSDEENGEGKWSKNDEV